MSIQQDILDYPGTIPFLGVPVGIEIDNNMELWSNVNFTKDMVLKITFPKGVESIDEVADKAKKYFDGDIISIEPNMIILKVDLKMIAYTLMFSFKNQYFNIS